MRIIKPQQLGILSRPFEYRGACYLGVSVIAAVRLSNPHELLAETEMWEKVIPAIGAQPLDLGMPKRNAEVLVTGSAHAPADQPTPSLRVGVQLGRITREIWVFGDRFLDGDQISAPQPFLTIPLGWEQAFGGEGFERNPLGKGVRETTNARGERRHWLPNLEDPSQLFRLKGQRPEPASLGPVDISWPQRVQLAGTYDSKWLKTRFPGFADDIRWEYFNQASRSQWSPEPWAGDESFRLYGVNPRAPVIEGALPGLKARCFVRREGESALEECPCKLTTVWFFPDIDQIVLIHHGSVRVQDDDARDIQTVVIAAEHADRPRELGHYERTHAERIDPDGSLTELINDEVLVPEGMARSILAPLLEAYENQRRSPLARNLDESMAQTLDDLRAQTADLGESFPEHLVPQRSVEPLPKFEELEDFMEQKLQEIEDARLDAEQQRAKAHTMVREGFANLEGYGPTPDEIEATRQRLEQEGAHKGPPDFKAAGLRDQLRQQISQLQAIAVDTTELEAQLNDEEQFQSWCEAQSELENLYRQSAHLQSPIGPATDSDSLRQTLLAKLDAGESLSAQDFSGIDLSGVDLRNRDLSGVFMESAVLDQADLSGAKLDHAVLAHASLRGTVLDRASLNETNLGHAHLKDVRAREALFHDTILQGSQVENCDFSGAQMRGMQLFLEVRFSGCTFKAACLEDLLINETTIADTDFSNATLVDPVFIKAELDRADFSGAIMEESVFVGCSVIAVNFAGARLAGTCFVDQCCLADSDFSGADLTRVNLRGSIVHRCCFDQSNLSEADLSEVEAGGASFRWATAAQSRWVRADLREADLSGARLTAAIMHKADIRGARFGANLYLADLARVHVERSTDFNGAFTAKMNTYPRKFPDQESSDA